MPSNFDFLKENWSFLHEDAIQAEQNAFIAPRTSAFYARRVLEKAVEWLYAHDSTLRLPYKANLAAHLYEPTFQKLLPHGLYRQVKLVHAVGNQAVHSNNKLSGGDGLNLTKATHNLASWLVRLYTSKDNQIQIPQFQISFIPKQDEPQDDNTSEQLERLQDRLKARDDVIRAANKQLQEREEELKKLQSQIEQIKAANEAAVEEVDYSLNEEATRKLYIDVLLREAGWDPKAKDCEEYPVVGMPTEKGEGYVDYVLWGKNGKPLAVVEAKRTSKSKEVGKQQANLYANCLEEMTGQRPIIYYTNGYEYALWDDTMYPPREVQGFGTHDELQLMINRRDTRGDITNDTVDKDITNRYYSIEGIMRVMERYANERARESLLVMATGSGKTRISIATVELLMKNNWVKRVLFLADRTALVKQARNAFKQFLPNVNVVNLVNEKEDDKSRIVFSTYHTIINLIDERNTEGEKRFGTNYFDLIIVDEAHRSVYQKFGAIFKYFDSLMLGLTATPKAEIDKNTYRLFNLEDGVPTYSYELDQAVKDGYLVPPHPMTVPLKFQSEGIKYDDLSEEEKEQYEAEENFYDEQTGQMKLFIEPEALNKWLFNIDTVDKVLKTLWENGQRVEGGDQLGKTIIFAKNQQHADFIVERFDKNFPHLAGHFCASITHQINYAQSLIDDFSVATKDPHIAVSVDMLDTGIDVPEVVNLVFFKIVRSKTKFWQMIGRGTRLCPDLFGPDNNKQCFYVFDFCGNLEYFNALGEASSPESTQEPLTQRLFKRRLELVSELSKSTEAGADELRAGLIDSLHGRVSKMNLENFIVRPERKYVEKYMKREQWDELTKPAQIEIENHISGLPSQDDDDEFERRFDLLILNIQIGKATGTAASSSIKRVIRLAKALEKKQNIPAIKQHLELIQQVQQQGYWDSVSISDLEKLRLGLRGAIRLIDNREDRKMAITDFEDEIGEIDHKPITSESFVDLASYKLKVERIVRENENYEAIRKLKNNEPITPDGLKALEGILYADLEDEQREALKNDIVNLGFFVRNIVGLDMKAAKEAFSTLNGMESLTADQRKFLDQIIEHLVINGVMKEEVLFDEPPFTDFHTEGLSGVFPERSPQIINIIRTINENAMGLNP